MPDRKDHTERDVYEALASIKEKLAHIPTREELAADIRQAFIDHRELFCFRLHPVYKKGDGNGSGDKDFVRLAKFIGAMIGAAILAGSGGYFFGR